MALLHQLSRLARGALDRPGIGCRMAVARPRFRDAIIKSELPTFQFEEAMMVDRPFCHHSALLCALAAAAGTQGRRNSNDDIVAIDPTAPLFFRGRDRGATLASGWCRPSTRLWVAQVLQEVTMVDPARRARLVRELEQDFLPDYDASNMPAADKRAAYALEHIAFRVGRIEKDLARIAAAIEAVLAKA